MHILWYTNLSYWFCRIKQNGEGQKREEFDEYTKLMHEKFPESICMGATTIAAFSKNGADKQGF